MNIAMLWKLGPWIALAVLAGLFLWQRNSLTAAQASRDSERAANAQLVRANATAQDALQTLKAARVDNDAIATAVAARIGSNRAVETRTNTIIKEATANDPEFARCASLRLPSSVRDALNAAR